MRTLSKLTLAAGFALALAFIFSACASEEDLSNVPNGDENGTESSSSADTGNSNLTGGQSSSANAGNPSSPSGQSSSSVQGSNSGNLCNGREYDPEVYRCVSGELIGKCAGKDYYPAHQECSNGTIKEIVRTCKDNHLGKGYNVINSSYINWMDVRKSVLDQKKMCNDDIISTSTRGGAQQYSTVTGSSVRELYQKMNLGINVGVEIDVALIFSAKLDAKFSMAGSTNSSQRYLYSQLRSYLYTEEDQITGSTTAQGLSKYLTSDFLSDLESSKSAAAILEDYGTHILIRYYKGGSLEANYTYTGTSLKTTSQMDAAVKGSFSKVDVGINYSEASAASELEENMSFNYQAYGGSDFGATSMSQLLSGYNGWVKSIENKAEMCGIPSFSQGLISIWDLAAAAGKATRAEALKTEFIKQAEAQGLKFPKEDWCIPADNDQYHYCSNGTLKAYGSMDVGGKSYKTVEIGTQTWMAENLNYATGGSVCYDEQTPNCSTYGRLYDWATAMGFASSCNFSTCSSQINDKHRGICPVGWHLPNYDDWNKLFNYVGGKSTAGKHLKATSWSGSSPNANGQNITYNGQDTYGFTALPSGTGISNGTLYQFENYSENAFWSASEDNSGVYGVGMSGLDDSADWGAISKNNQTYYMFSVRCLKD